MANQSIPTLPVAISLDGSEQLEIVQPAGANGTSRRATAAQIANTATAFLPSTRSVNTLSDSGLEGGGNLAQDLNLSLDPSNLQAKATPVPADLTILGNSANANAPVKATIAQFYTSIDGLPELNFPSLSNDYLVIYHDADASSYKINLSSFTLPSGNVPAGGLTGQVLTKSSNTDYDTIWDSITVATGGTGLSTVAQGDLLYGSATDVYSLLSKSTSATRYLSNTGANNNPAWAQIDLANGVTGTLPITNGGTGQTSLAAYSVLLGNGTSGIASVAPSATAGLALVSTGSTSNPDYGTVVVAGGGTGLTTYAQGDLIYSTAPDTLGVLAKNTTATRYLSNTGTNNAPAWAQINITNGVTGVLPIANGGTNLSSFNQGDLVYASASNTLAALPKSPSTTRYLSNTGTDNNPAWAQIDITTGVTGTLPVSSGGTGITSLPANRLLLGNGISAISSFPAMTDGQLIVGATGLTPTAQTMSGDATLAADGALTIANSAVTLAKMASISTGTFLGNVSGSMAAPAAVTAANVATAIGALTTSGGQTLTGGFALPAQSLGTISTTTSVPINFLLGAHQSMTISGATTVINFTAPAVDGECIIQTTNSTAIQGITFPAGAIALAGSAIFSTAINKVHWIFLYRIAGRVAYAIQTLV